MCQLSNLKNQKEPLINAAIPSIPWTKIGANLCELNEKCYSVLIDYNSKFPTVREIQDETSSVVIQSIKGVLSEFGNIKELISDNRPCFRSHEFNKFIKTYRITHVTVSPHHHQSNGQVERCIRTIKGLLKKNADPWMSLLIWRLTPVDDDLKSPAELVNECKYQSNLPLIRKTSTQTSSHKGKLVAK